MSASGYEMENSFVYSSVQLNWIITVSYSIVLLISGSIKQEAERDSE